MLYVAEIDWLPQLRHITTAFLIGQILPATFSFAPSRNESVPWNILKLVTINLLNLTLF